MPVVDPTSGTALSFTLDKDGSACVVVTSLGSSWPAAGASTVADCTKIVAAAEAALNGALEAEYPRSKVGDSRDVVDAIRAVMGWNTMFDHRATVITPVSRSFGQMPFEMWEWDTYFSTLLAAESDKHLAYSNLIEITRPTVAGNVPGFRTATASVQDRSKPFVGALVLEQLYKKFKDVWIVELLFDDLLMWTNWIRDKRIEEPAGLVVLGSDNVAKGQSDGHQCTRVAVIFESGLDNSPLYDTSEVGWDYPPRHAGVPVGTSCR
jgi:putative isomerase